MGVSSGAGRASKRGPILGLAFSVPSAVVAYSLGLRFVPYDLAFVIGGVIAGLLIGVIVDSATEGATTAIEPNPGHCDPALDPADEAERWVREKRVQRLAEGKACLDRLDAERRSRGREAFGKNLEDRVVWGEAA